MDIKNYFELQKQLDAPIVEKHNLQNVDLFPKKKLAFKDELSELLHEWRGHKFWSLDQKPRTKVVRNPTMMEEDKEYYNPLLGEYVDGLHFVLSVGLEKGWEDYIVRAFNVIPVPETVDVKDETVDVFNGLFENPITSPADYVRLMRDYAYLGGLLRFTNEEIEIAYLEKNALNHTRQVLNY